MQPTVMFLMVRLQPEWPMILPQGKLNFHCRKSLHELDFIGNFFINHQIVYKQLTKQEDNNNRAQVSTSPLARG